MKKQSFLIASLLIMTLLMTACASTEGAKVAEIYQKSLDASKQLESFSMKMESVQHVSTGDLSSESAEETRMPGVFL
ncbi:hypothetical protein MUN89_09295 [Halobacillus salinarum]|uniref:Lipoprotein n=1 Tax=Halobacillus salinarum TaxID=2932257 RepID=A0ABY4EQ21_9BACI|nr:DUF6612 family protein [Halobacillus salinarum]UOQ46085.1 hypothetical protein MUN89_09295 [Halobacillus salinarum]